MEHHKLPGPQKTALLRACNTVVRHIGIPWQGNPNISRRPGGAVVRGHLVSQWLRESCRNTSNGYCLKFKLLWQLLLFSVEINMLLEKNAFLAMRDFDWSTCRTWLISIFLFSSFSYRGHENATVVSKFLSLWVVHTLNKMSNRQFNIHGLRKVDKYADKATTGVKRKHIKKKKKRGLLLSLLKKTNQNTKQKNQNQ